jgi:superfamily II DNA or RNA helicase
MAKTNALIPVRYRDEKSGIRLTSYADFAAYDDAGGRRTLCAIRFGGYPEQTEALSAAIYGGGTIEADTDGGTIVLHTLAKRYKRSMNRGTYAEATLYAEDDLQSAEKARAPDDEDKDLDDAQTPSQELPPRNAYIYVASGDKAALYAAIDQKTAAPMIPAFADYIIAELKRRGALKPLKTIPADISLEAWLLRCEVGDRNIIQAIEDGLKSGAITIPGTTSALPAAPSDDPGKALKPEPESAPPLSSAKALGDIRSVTAYLTRYGTAIAERIKTLFDPLFDPERDELSPEIIAVNESIREKAGYSLYYAQLAAAEAIKRQLARHKTGLVIAECGAGKTKIGLAAIAAATAGLTADQTRRKRRRTMNVVLCPAHVAEKWAREIHETLPDTFAAIVSTPSGFERLYAEYIRSGKSCYAVISKEAARDGYMRSPAVRWSKTKRAFVCPDCGEVIQMEIMNGAAKYLADADQFFFKSETRRNHKCARCGAQLWTALNPNAAPKWVKVSGYGFIYAPMAREHLRMNRDSGFEEKLRLISEGAYRTKGAHRKYPLSTYIKNRYGGRIDGLIIDELHQYANDSGQGDAMAELYNAAKKTVCMTATLVNGYASGIFHLLYRLVPGLMQKDGKRHDSPKEFIEEYGVIETTYEIDEGGYNANRRTIKRKKSIKQLPGVSPLVYSRFLLEHAAFLSLSDMSKNLPEYEEIPIAVTMPNETAKEYDRLSDKLREFMREDKKCANRLLSVYLNLLTAYPDQPYGHEPITHPITGDVIVTPIDTGAFDDKFPKDEETLKIVERKLSSGENVLIYVNRTGLDTQKRLMRLLTDAGRRAEIMPASVAPKKRERWVQAQLDRGVRVLITNPSLVETGLDINAFTTIIFYDMGYKLFTLRQASRRSLRINQTAPRVEVYLIYYANTMQHKAVKLMGTKIAVASIIEGGYSEEGLAAMSRCEDLATIMAKELMLGIRDSVEDVSAAFRKMATTKPKAERKSELVTFGDEPERHAEFLPEPVEFAYVQHRDQTAAPELEAFTHGEQLTIFDMLNTAA